MYSFPSYKFNELQKKIKDGICLINTMPDYKQECLIKYTIKAHVESERINLLLKGRRDEEIIVYGIHHTDMSVIKKYNQLKKLGFKNVFIYFGGMYEWLLLQEVFGVINFQTDGIIRDIIEYKIE